MNVFNLSNHPRKRKKWLSICLQKCENRFVAVLRIWIYREDLFKKDNLFYSAPKKHQTIGMLTSFLKLLAREVVFL